MMISLHHTSILKKPVRDTTMAYVRITISIIRSFISRMSEFGILRAKHVRRALRICSMYQNNLCRRTKHLYTYVIRYKNHDIFSGLRYKAGVINNSTLVIIFNIFSYKIMYTAILSYQCILYRRSMSLLN